MSAELEADVREVLREIARQGEAWTHQDAEYAARLILAARQERDMRRAGERVADKALAKAIDDRNAAWDDVARLTAERDAAREEAKHYQELCASEAEALRAARARVRELEEYKALRMEADATNLRSLEAKHARIAELEAELAEVRAEESWCGNCDCDGCFEEYKKRLVTQPKP